MVGIACWGLTPVILRTLTPYIDAWTANGIRYPVAAILYWPLLWHAARARKLDLALVRRCLVPAICSLGGQVFWALAFYELPASEVGFLVRLSMVWSILGAMTLFRDERQLLKRPGFYVGVALVVVGFLGMTFLRDAETVASPDAASKIQAGNYTLGLIYILCCGFFFGFYMVSVRKCIPDVNPLLSFGIVANLVSIGTITAMFFKGDVHSIAEQTQFAWLLLVGSSLLGIALGHVTLFFAVQRLGASVTSSCQTMMPFVTAVVASFVLGERLTVAQWIAGGVMVVGVIVLLSVKNDVK